MVFGLGLIYFFWGLVGLIRSSDKDRENAKQRMLWGIVALFVMVAIGGILNFLIDTSGIPRDKNQLDIITSGLVP